MNHKQVHIGTSGWSYDHWKGCFYPDGLPNNRMLDYYTQHFHSVEINSSFYHLPRSQTLSQWQDTVPDGFLFSAKASRYITHMKKLKGPAESVHNFLDRISILGDTLGPILFQLPPRWHFNSDRLETFLKTLSSEFRYAFEFRDQSWLNEETYTLLARFNMSFCIYDLDGFLSPKETTTDFVYVRLHGPDGPYQGSYDVTTLSGWASTFSTWSARGKAIFCYFDNDQLSYAPHNAKQLQAMLKAQLDPPQKPGS